MISNPKPDHIMSKVRRHMKRRETKNAEERIMRQVRAEDRYCRMPLCGCGKLKLVLDVCHAGADGHRGIGGNPSLSATTPENLILLCRPRHRAHKFAIDKGTLRVEPLTDRGLRGPVRWLVHVPSIPLDWYKDSPDLYLFCVQPDEWALLAVETSPHAFEPFTRPQIAILKLLATMEC